MRKELKQIIKALREAKRLKYIHDFALTGALALSAFSRPRATRDIDILVLMDKENVKAFAEWLKLVKEYRLTKHYIGKPSNHIKDLIELPLGNTWADLIVAPGEIEKRAVIEGITITVFKNVKIKIVRPEYLLILKLISGSEQDYIDCAELWNMNIDKNLVRKLAGQFFIKRNLRRMISIVRRFKKDNLHSSRAKTLR